MFKQLFGRRRLLRTPQVHNQPNTSSSDSSKPLSASLQENLTTIQTILHHPSDLLIRHFTIGTNQYPCALVSIDGLVDIAMINDQLLSPMLHSFDHAVTSSSELIKVLKQQILTAYELETVELLDDALMAILSGDTILLLNNLSQCIIISSCGWKTRSIEEPQTESIIRGP